MKRFLDMSFSWLKFTLLVLLIIGIIGFTYIFLTYRSILNSNTSDLKETEQYLRSNTDLMTIEELVRFQELDEYHIAFGETDDGEQQFVFVPISNYDDKLTFVNETDIINKDDMKKQWMNTCEPCKFISIKPAILNNTPLWELIYYDESNHYVISYLSMDDGAEYETIHYKGH